MKKFQLRAGLLALLALAGGCIFGGSSGRVCVYDLERPADAPVQLPCQITFSLFRNLSGSDRRFLERRGKGQMQADEFNRWILDPELMLERYFRDQLRGGAGPQVRVRGVVTAFEFDKTENKARLSIDFTLQSGGRRSRFVSSRSCPVASEGAAKAMSLCAAGAAGDLKAHISAFIREK